MAAAILIALVAYTALVGLSVDASRWREPLERRLSERLGRPVAIQGALRLSLSQRASLDVSELRIAEPQGTDPAGFARLGQARLELDLRALLVERRLRIRSLTGADLALRLRQAADGSNNWSLPRAQGERVGRDADVSTGASTTAKADVSTSTGAGLASLERIEFESIRLERVSVSFERAAAPPHWFELDRLDGHFAPLGQSSFRLLGKVEKRFDYELNIETGSLAGLWQDGARAPFSANLNFVGSTVTVDGVAWRAANELAAQFRFGLGTTDLQEIERLLQIELPKVGTTALAGVVDIGGNEIRIGSLIGNMGASRLSGELRIEELQGRPRVSGALTMPSFDMRPFLKQTADAPADEPKSLSDWYRDIAKAEFSLDQLAGFDANLELSVDQWLSLPGEVRQVAMTVQLQDGRLLAPLRATVAGVALTGELTSDASAGMPDLSLRLATRDSPLGGLGRLLFGLRTVQGRLGSFELHTHTQGRQVAQLVENLAVDLTLADADLSYGQKTADLKPVAFTLSRLALSIPAGQRLRATANGSLLGKPVTATLDSDTLARMMQGRAPVVMTANSRSARARIEAVLDERGEASDIMLNLTAERASDLAAWLNLQVRTERSVQMSGQASWSTRGWALSNGRLRVGRSELRMQARQSAQLDGRIDIETLDLADLEAVLPPSASSSSASSSSSESSASPAATGATATDSARPRLILDIPVLPANIDLSDADFEVRIGRILGHPLRPAAIAFQARLRDGQMLASPFALSLLDVPFAGALSLDLRGSAPLGEAWISAENIDLTRPMRELRLAQAPPVQLQSLRAHLKLSGRRLGDLLDGSRLVAEIEGGRVLLADANTGAKTTIAIARGAVRSELGAPLSIELTGAMENYPLQIALETAPVAELLATQRRLPFSIDARSLGHRLRVKGSLNRSLDERDADLSLNLQGDDLQTLSGLARVALPHWGPYSLEAGLRLSRQGYALPAMNLTIGKSRLSGQGRLDTAATPPRLDVELTASQIQIQDFPIDIWTSTDSQQNSSAARAGKARSGNAGSGSSSGPGRVPGAGPGSVSDSGPDHGAETPSPDATFDLQALRDRAAAASDQAQRLLSPTVLGRQNANVRIRVDEVLSGQERLGEGRLSAAIDSGRAVIGPIDLRLPGGSVSAHLSYYPRADSASIEARLKAEHFDYGVLARQASPGTDLRGRVSIDLDLRAQAPSLAQAMRHGNGTLDFTVWPENLRTGIIDLWAANLFFSLAQRSDPSGASRINCGIGRFSLTNGLLTDRQIVLDTSRVRVEGHGQADFRDEQLSLNLRPYPKQAQFFSLATPIAVSGNFAKPEIATAPGAILETAVRLGSSLVWVPIQKLLGHELPADGSDICPVAPN